MSKMKIAMLQTSVCADKNANVENVQRLLATGEYEGAPLADADLVTLPEMFCCPYQTANFPSYAEPEGGAAWSACSDLAREFGVYLSAGTMPEVDAQGRVYNTAYVFNRRGEQIAKHRKAHLFDIDVKGGQSFRESDTLTAGDSFSCFDTEFGKFGICVCYDIRFPEGVRLMALDGAKLILVPAAFNMTTGPMHWELLFRQRAVENQLFTVGTAPARDEQGSYVSYAHSIVCDPWGKVVADLGSSETSRLIEVDFAVVEEAREQLPQMSQRRTDVYELKRVER